MAQQPALIIQVPRGSAVARQLQTAPPPAIGSHEVVIQTAATDDAGNLEELAGDVVLSLLAPEELTRQAEEVQRVLRHAGTGTAPLVILIEAGEELQDDQLTLVLGAAERAPRPVILRIVRPSER